MYNKALIEKICNLTCTEEDVHINQTSISYDTEHPFRKYYNFNTIESAIRKYLNHEWSDYLLSGWACLYSWILSGGFDDSVIEDFNDIEFMIVSTILEDLDGISFFDNSLVEDEDDPVDLNRWIEEFRSLDTVLQSIDSWTPYTSKIGPYTDYNDDRFTLLVNDTNKEYIIIYHFFGESDDYTLNTIDEKEHLNKVIALKEAGYTLLPHSEDYYFELINDNKDK